MTTELTAKHSTAVDCRRIIRKTVSSVLEELAHFEHKNATDHYNRDDIVHEIRKHLKTARAILRLLREVIGDKTYHAENVEIRDVSRPFGTLRDAKILIETFDRFTDHEDLQGTTNALQYIRQQLVASKQKAGRATQKNSFIESLQKKLNELLDRMDRWPGDGQSWKRARAGLKRTYKAGRKAWQATNSSRSNRKLHEWRKQAKYLRYQLEFLHPIWPAALGQLAEMAHDLTDHLGEDHDLAVLSDEIRKESLCPDGHLRLRIERHIKSRRAELQRMALEIGSELYGAGPDLFDSRIQECHHEWKKNL